MFYTDSKNQRKIAAQLQRVLILEPTPAHASVLGDLVRSMGGQELYCAVNQDGAMRDCASINPQIIFSESSGAGLDGLDFVRALRRSTMACRKAPVILMTGETTAPMINAARDAGVHEFLRKPFTIGDVIKRLEAVILRNRSWVEGIDYIGPDRRRFNSAEFVGVLKRKSDHQSDGAAHRAKQALQILASAMGAIDSDPTQALRAMAAQVQELQAVAVETGNAPLGTAALQLENALRAAARNGRISRRDFDIFAAALCQIMPAAELGAVPATLKPSATAVA
jgi:DNA-binding response OmpR family regulator